jgi:hypothetical protein
MVLGHDIHGAIGHALCVARILARLVYSGIIRHGGYRSFGNNKSGFQSPCPASGAVTADHPLRLSFPPYIAQRRMG